MEERDRKDLEINELREQMNKMQKDLQDIKEFELQRLKNPNYGWKKQQQEVADEMKRTGKDLMTVLSEKLSIGPGGPCCSAGGPDCGFRCSGGGPDP